jgi:hypothetical protein
MAPDEAAFRADVAKATFRAGAVQKRWRLLDIAWPYANIAVAAKDGREYALRFNVAGFPSDPPTATLWDTGRNAPLAHALWPKSAGGRVSAVFNPNWKNGTALYLPCDRESIAGHENWRAQMPSKIWRPSEGVTQYLESVHELLHCKDYSSPVCAAA